MSFVFKLEEETLQNNDYRRVVYTYPGMFQMVLMNIPMGEDIPLEKHDDVLQFIRVESGEALVTVGKDVHSLSDGDSIVIEPGNWHQVINSSNVKELKFYSIYAPPEHVEGLVQGTV